MILAAGLGTRLRPLTEFRAKPALPVCGRPVVSLLLEMLSRQGVQEALINLHYLPDSVRRAIEGDHPPNMKITWSEEKTALGTGGGIRRAADFLSGSEECLVLAGDMLLDIDLEDLRRRHRASQRDVTLILRSDDRGADFGTIGLNEKNMLTRIGKRELSGVSQYSQKQAETDWSEVDRGLFTGVRFFSRGALEDWPESETFEDLRDWLAPRIESGGVTVGAEILDCSQSVWEPVGTPAEYLKVNLSPPDLPSLGGGMASWCGAIKKPAPGEVHNVISVTASVPRDAKLQDCVVWEEEHVPAGFHGRNGVYAGGAFHPCGTNASGSLE